MIVLLAITSSNSLTERSSLPKLTISLKEVEDIERIAKQILKKYPPEQYFYIGIGRSPAALMAFFEDENIMYANVPLSDFRYRLKKDVVNKEKGKKSKTYRPLNEYQKEMLFRHFDNYLPRSESILAQKKLLIIDYASSGKSQIAAHEHIKKYYEQYNDVDVTVEMATIYADQSSVYKVLKRYSKHLEKLNKGASNCVHHISYSANTDLFLQHLDQQKYDDFSEYGSMKLKDLLKDPPELGDKRKREEGYKKLLTSIHHKRIELMTKRDIEKHYLKVKKSKLINWNTYKSNNEKEYLKFRKKVKRRMRHSSRKEYPFNNSGEILERTPEWYPSSSSSSSSGSSSGSSSSSSSGE